MDVEDLRKEMIHRLNDEHTMAKREIARLEDEVERLKVRCGLFFGMAAVSFFGVLIIAFAVGGM